MVLWSLKFVTLMAVASFLLLCLDALARALVGWKRRQRAQGGVYGVVVNARGQVIATYVNPLQAPRRSVRVHGPGSVWTGSDPSDPTAWAWEGQAETQEEALHAANRIRHLYTSLLPELQETGPEDDWKRAYP